MYVPEVYHALCTRRLLVTEWIDGVKLSDCEGAEVQELTALGQECFLVQLLQVRGSKCPPPRQVARNAPTRREKGRSKVRRLLRAEQPHSCVVGEEKGACVYGLGVTLTPTLAPTLTLTLTQYVCVCVCVCVCNCNQVGFFHSDPHPGNLMKMNDTSKGRLALLDFGLVATVKQEEIDTMVNSIVHLANKDYTSLVDDFIALNILPADCDRSLVEPLMDKALSPYVKGGGAKKYEEELKKIYGFDESGAVGGFQAMTTDMLTVSAGEGGGLTHLHLKRRLFYYGPRLTGTLHTTLTVLGEWVVSTTELWASGRAVNTSQLDSPRSNLPPDIH